MHLLRTMFVFTILIIVGCEKVVAPESSIAAIDSVEVAPVDSDDVTPVDSVEVEVTPVNTWAIPSDKVLFGGPGKDGIPAVDQPEMLAVDQINYLDDDDLVIGVMIDGQPKAYPHKVLNWHEITNDHTAGTYYAVTYCPLTGSALCWDRTLDGEVTTFGVSGLLYNSNLIPYDRATDSYWSQLLIKGVFGTYKDEPAITYQVMETSWLTWKTLFPQSTVQSTDTGYNRDYSRNPYGNYPTSSRLMFPIEVDDDQLHRKERVLGIVADGQARVYRLSSFIGGTKTINDTYMGIPVVIAGASTNNFMVSFNRIVDGVTLSFTPLQDELPTVMLDDEGTKWDVFGRGISGPRAGQQLAHIESFIAYWFAFGTFYPGVEIFTE